MNQDSETDITNENALFDKIVRILGVERRVANSENLVKRAQIIAAIGKYGDLRDIDARLDEYLNAEQAWLNYVQDDYFNDRQEQLQSLKEREEI